MGLDTSHDCWHGAYSAFSRWRNKIAETAGYAVWNVQYEGGYSSPTAQIDWGHITQANLEGHWDETPADPLLVLLAHSDCDGWIHPAQAKPLADRLEELLPELPEGEGGGHIRGWRETTQRFIDGLRAAAEAGEDVEFA
jgi:hypothetical protein